MPKKIHPRGAEWERGRQAGYYAGKKSNLAYLRECREENARLRAAVEMCHQYFTGQPVDIFAVVSGVAALCELGG